MGLASSVNVSSNEADLFELQIRGLDRVSKSDEHVLRYHSVVAPEFSDRGAGTSYKGAKMIVRGYFRRLFCQNSSDESPKLPPTGI